jgi:hypothetical protein
MNTSRQHNLTERCPDCRRLEFEVSYQREVPVTIRCLNTACGLQLQMMAAQPARSGGRDDSSAWEAAFQRAGQKESPGQLFDFLIPGA